MNKRTVATLALTVLCGCGGGSGGDDSDQSIDNSRINGCETIGLKIANGASCSVPAGSASPLVGLVITYADGSAGTCTGTVVGPNRILTAGHCFIDDVVQASAITSAGVFGISGFRVPSDFSVFQGTLGPIFADDLAIVETQGSMPIAPLPLLLSRAPSVGEDAVVAGVGEVSPNEGADSIQAGNALVQNVTPNHVFIVYEDDQAHPCRGDSGGPLIVFQDGRPAVAGVVSQSDPQVGEDGICEPGDVTLYTNVQSGSATSFLSLAAPDAGGI